MAWLEGRWELVCLWGVVDDQAWYRIAVTVVISGIRRRECIGTRVGTYIIGLEPKRDGNTGHN